LIATTFISLPGFTVLYAARTVQHIFLATDLATQLFYNQIITLKGSARKLKVQWVRPSRMRSKITEGPGLYENMQN